jgi:aspartate racemase
MANATTGLGRGHRTIGVIGGIGPESTVDYYRALIAQYRETVADGS